MYKYLLTILFFIISLPVLASDINIQNLPNGQTLIIKEIHNNPIVTIDTWVKTGSIDENDSNSGVAHFLEHLFFKGTKKYPVGEFDKILESKGAIINAATSKDFTHYYITIPSEFFDEALELHSDMLINPQIPRKELEQERKVVLEEIAKDLNSPSKIAYNNLNDLLYSIHPYKRKVIGSTDVISTIRREEILEFFNDNYSPSNMVTIIIGDVDSEKAKEKVLRLFNSAYKKPIKKTYKKERPLMAQKRKVEYLDTELAYLMMGFRGADIFSNDTFALDVLAQILGGGKSSKLYKNIKEQKGIAYSIQSYNGSFKDDGILYINANTSASNVEKLEKSIFDEITYIQKYGVTEEELNIAKKMIEQNIYFDRESNSNIASELGYIVTLTGSANLYENYIDNIKNVSANDVQRIAQKYLGVNKSAISIVLPKSDENVKIKEKKKHIADKISESKGITKYLVDNKSILLINNHSNNDIIAINILAKGGQFLEKIPGTGALVANTMLNGTKKYSSQELTQLMEENGIKIKAESGEDFFSIKLQTTTSQMSKALDILNEIINNSIFEDYEIEKKRSEMLNKIKESRDIPMNIAIDDLKTLIYENSVYSNSSSVLEKTLPKITRKDLKDYYNKIFDSKNIVISINGNVNNEEMINSFGEIFTDKNQPVFEYKNYSLPKLKISKIVSKKINNLQTAWLFIAWQTAGFNNEKDFITLKVIDTLLGNGMSSRLFMNLRNEFGLAYQLGSNYNAKVLGGMLYSYIGTNPENLDEAKVKIKSEIERLKMEFVSDTELENAKNRLKGGFVLALETNLEKASTIASFEAIGRGYDYYGRYVKLIDEVTASDIVRVANKYFGPYLETSVSN